MHTIDNVYEVIYCDPPWDYKGQRQHTRTKESGGAVAHYPTMTLNELKKLPIRRLCDCDCLLFMWTSSPHLPQAIELGLSWGFQYATVAFVWDKQKTNPGFYTLSQCELCLVFKRGRIPRMRGSRGERQLVSSLRREHSRKPDEVREAIARMFPVSDKIELFARQRHEGWDAWGDEI